MVTFDKGARVARITPGAVLDARQVGILFSQTDPDHPDTGSVATLIGWDRGHSAAATRRMDELLDKKGPCDKTTLLLALSLGVLQDFDLRTAENDIHHFSGDRVKGFRLMDIEPGCG